MIRRAAKWWPLLIVLGGAVVLALVAQPADFQPPLHPDSTAADGTKALIDSLEELGADVEAHATEPSDSTQVAMLLRDQLDEPGRDALRDWVAEGGTLVLADPESELAPAVEGPAGSMLAPSRLTDDACPIMALADVTRIDPGDPSVLYADDPEWTGCFQPDAGESTGNWLAARTHGDGTIVALGGPEVLTNGMIDAADHSMLAAALLAPGSGTELAVLGGDASIAEPAGITDLIPQPVIIMLVQLAIAFCVFAWWRGSRHGRVMTEPQPVELPSSEFVAATGRLWHQSRARRRAADVMAADVRRTIAERLGLPHHASPEQLADALAARTGADRDEALATLTAPSPASDDAMLRHIERLDALRATIKEGARS